MPALTKPTLLIMRHGETDDNAQHLLRGWDDPPLNPDGHKQAAEAADKLNRIGIPLHHIYYDPLIRTRETAEHISRKLGVGMSETLGLLPWNYGDFTLQKENRVNLKKLEWFQKHRDVKTPNGESYQEFLDRWDSALAQSAKYVHKYPEKALLLSTHSRNLYPLEHLVSNSKVTKIPMKHSDVQPGSIHKLEFNPDGSYNFNRI